MTTKETPSEEQAQQDAEKIVKLMTEPMKFYQSERQENEIDLISTVRQKLVDAGLSDRLPECFDDNRFIQEAKNRPAHAQQYNLNRYFCTQFMAAEEEASLERYALIYEIKPTEWLEIFDKTILPAVVNYNLPIKV